MWMCVRNNSPGGAEPQATARITFPNFSVISPAVSYSLILFNIWLLKIKNLLLQIINLFIYVDI